ncbi:pectinesterase inhibitor 9-like [Curcuma longa]|uniref:pectinesterase inhibitor 9-like n=1 Tax=Curcuma longa TaxID=136217 RepID=UPI003D9EEADC
MSRKLCLFSVFFLLAAEIRTPLGASELPRSARKNATEFIRSRCGATQYPGLCYTSLAGYSSAVQQNPAQLARLSANVTLSRIAVLMARVAVLARACHPRNASAPACPEAAALRDCAETLGYASDLTRKTEGELRELVEGPAAGPADASWRVSNAQTWLSAVLTDEETCADGFEEVASGSLTKADVSWRLRRLKQYTINALALVNNLASY